MMIVCILFPILAAALCWQGEHLVSWVQRFSPNEATAQAYSHGNNTGVDFKHNYEEEYFLMPDLEEQRLRSRGSFYIWNNDRRYLGCVVPKSGCSSWLHYLRKMSLPEALFQESQSQAYLPKSYDKYGLHFRKSMSIKDMHEFEYVVNNPLYFKWAVVRHPWRRLVSGFRSKYEGQCNFRRKCMREKFNIPILDSHEPLGFHEFVTALSTIPSVKLDRHFKPATLLCELDRVHYNYFGDLHNSEHMDYISKRLGFDASFSDVESSTAAHTFGPRYYGGRTHAIHNCSVHTVRMAAEMYAEDCRLLGYDFADAMHACGTYGVTSLPVPAESTPLSPDSSAPASTPQLLSTAQQPIVATLPPL